MFEINKQMVYIFSCFELDEIEDLFSKNNVCSLNQSVAIGHSGINKHPFETLVGEPYWTTTEEAILRPAMLNIRLHPQKNIYLSGFTQNNDVEIFDDYANIYDVLPTQKGKYCFRPFLILFTKVDDAGLTWFRFNSVVGSASNEVFLRDIQTSTEGKKLDEFGLSKELLKYQKKYDMFLSDMFGES